MKALLLVMGMIGTGKSTLARALAQELGMTLISSDPLRKELAGLDPYEKREEVFGQGLYSPEMTERVYVTMVKRASELLKQGRGVILDATFSQKRWRDLARRMAQELEVPCLLVVTTAPPDVVKERLEKRKGRKVVSDGRWEIYLKHRERFQEPQDEGPMVVLDTRESLNSLVENVKEVLNGL